MGVRDARYCLVTLHLKRAEVQIVSKGALELVLHVRPLLLGGEAILPDLTTRGVKR